MNKKYLFNEPKFRESQFVSFNGIICMVLLCTQESDIYHPDLGFVKTVFVYLLCDLNCQDIWRPVSSVINSEYAWSRRMIDGQYCERRIPEDEIQPLNSSQKLSLSLNSL